ADDSASRVAQGDAAGKEPAVYAVRTADAQLCFEKPPCLVGLAPFFHCCLVVVRVNGPACLAQALFVAEAGVIHPSRVDIFDIRAIRATNPNDLWHSVGKRAEHCLALL